MMRTPMPTMMRMIAKSRFILPPLDAGAGVCAGGVVAVVAVVSVVAGFDIVSVGSAGVGAAEVVAPPPSAALVVGFAVGGGCATLGTGAGVFVGIGAGGGG
jgi:hypothetical protein